MFKTLIASLALFVACTATSVAAEAETDVVKLQAGTWAADIEFFDAATGAVKSTARGMMTCRVIGDGRWVLDDFKVFDMPYQGLGTWGWDPQQKKFVGTWVDINQTYVRLDAGTWDAATRTMDWRARMPSGDKMYDWQFLAKYDGDRRTFEAFYFSPKTGEAKRTLKISFTRQPHG